MMELANKELTTAAEEKSVKLETEQKNYPMKTRESKRMKINKWGTDNVKQFNINITGVPEKGGEAEKTFEEMARIFPNWMKP